MSRSYQLLTKDLLKKRIKVATEQGKILNELMLELTILNEKYGGRLDSLTRKQLLRCPICGYQEVFTPHERILHGKYDVISTRVLEIQAYQSLQFHTIYWLAFKVNCGCNRDYFIPSWITPGHALRILREERDFVEKNKKRPYEAYIV